MTWRALVTDVAWPDITIEEEILGRAGIDVVLAPDTREPTLVELAQGCDAILTCFAQVTGAVLHAGPRIRVVARTGAGLDNIAVDTAAELGITVTRVPDYCIDEVAQHTVALALALRRRIPAYMHAIREGRWGIQPDIPIHRVRGSRAMVLGRGRIGSAVAEHFRSLGMVVVDQPDGADILSIHVPLTESTRNMVDAAYLERLAPGAVVVNTSRGAVIDVAAALAALDSGRLCGLGVDVLPTEPVPADSPLLSRPDVLVTPHVAFYSEESLVELRTRACASVVNSLKGNNR